MCAKNILIVDDDAGDRKIVHKHLLNLYPGANIHEASSGEQALALSEAEVDAAFVDYQLPGGTGLDLLSNFSLTWPRALLFIMTSQGDEGIAKNAILAGANDYIPKAAITPSALKRMIQNGSELADMRWQINEHQNELKLFSDVLVHDLRAPIRAVKFLCDQILEDYEAGEVEEVAREFDLMKMSVQKMSELIEQLATHIRPDSEGKSRLIPVEKLFEDAQMAMAHDILASSAQITWEDGGLTVLCFPPEVTQLLQNLIGNSIKYSGGGRPEIKVEAAAEPGGVRISVQDNGIGVPKQYRERIFEPFKRLQNTGDAPGTGLGLATCTKIAKRHNGRIWCDPEVQSGTVIHFTLLLS
ncbi:ATPase [Leisingera sp. ANG-Vp]|nr:ATPase [Leisingera sp. ANG-Vp]